MRVMIDPGHYGWDSGAVGPNKLFERDITMAISLMVADILRQSGLEVNLTRQPGNLNVVGSLNEDLTTRVQLANNWPADAFLSIHCNAAAQSSAHGMEVYTTRGQGQSDAWAELVIREMVGAFPSLSLRADTADGDSDKEANFYVITRTNMPAILVEAAFISNPTEEQLLADTNSQAKFAQALAIGTLKYLGAGVPSQNSPDVIAEAVAKLQAVGVIGQPDYWTLVARPGQKADGENVAALIINMAAKL